MVATGTSSDPRGVGVADLIPLLHPARLGAALHLHLAEETLRKLQNCRRLQGRLAGLMREHLTNEGLWPIAEPWAFFSASDDPRDAAMRAGAVWHAASLRLVVTGKAAAELVAAIGEQAFTFGLKHGAEAVAANWSADATTIAQAVERDGFACLGAWLANGPPSRRQAVFLQLSPDDAALAHGFDSGHRAACERVMALVFAEGSSA